MDATLRAATPVTWFIRTFSSIWLGVFWLAAIIVFSSVGSAVPPFRQFFELTEFAYFNHWIFVVLIGLFCLNLTVATVVRIPFNRYNLGVLTVHTGLLVLAGGSLLYFGRKIEGDVLLWNPRVQVLSAKRLHGTAGGDPVLGQTVAAKGRRWATNMPMAGGRVTVDVEDVRHEGLLTAAQADLRIQVGDGEAKKLTLRLDRPEERFARINEELLVQLVPTNVTDRFFDNQTPALLIRRGDREPMMLPIEGLPLYRERFVPGVEEIFDTRNQRVESDRLTPIPLVDPWRMPAPIRGPGGADLPDWPIRLEVDGYLPYAAMQSEPRPGGDVLNPIARIELSNASGTFRDWVIGPSPRDALTSSPDGAHVEFRWLGAASDIPKEWTRSVEGRHALEVWIKDKDVRRNYDIQPGQTIAVEGTDYTLKVHDLQPDWPLATPQLQGARTPIARIWVETPQRGYERSVLQRFPELNQDRDAQGQKLSDKGLVDENIELRYTNASRPWFALVAGESLSPVVIATAIGGKRSMQTLAPGGTITCDDTTLLLRELILRPKIVQQPVVIPIEQRRPQMARNFSMIRLRIASRNSDWQTRVWLPYEPYNDTYTGQLPHWESVRVPEIGELQFLYGRLTRPLPGRLALEEMQVEFFPGGERPAGWTSFIRWEDPQTRAITRGRAFLNNTARIGPWTLFQSSESSDHQSYTVLGVGNRDGVMTMLLGCTLVTIGMLYAFYVKPALKQRARRRLAAEAGARHETAASEPRGRALIEVGRVAPLALIVALLSISTAAAQMPSASARQPASIERLREIQGQLHLDGLRPLLVQHAARYKTVEAWAREVVSAIHGDAELLGLDPVVAAVDLMFNRAAYDDQPVIYVKDMVIRKNLTSHPVRLSAEEAKRIVQTGMVSFNFLQDPEVGAILQDLSGRMTIKRAVDRFNIAAHSYGQVLGQFNIIPDPTGNALSAWYGVDALFANLGMAGDHAHGGLNIAPVPGLEPARASALFDAFRNWSIGWLDRDAAKINAGIDSLAQSLPPLAPAGVYPPEQRRWAEVYYHRLDAFTRGWAIYFAAMLVSILALLGGWRWSRRFAFGLFAVAAVAHGVGIGLRWYVVGHVPVSNMFESVVSSAWVGVMLALVLELALKRGVFMAAGSFLGALSLLLGKFVGGEIVQMAPILDDIMLRIHTVLIISSYAIITLAFGVAVCYLFVAARGPEPATARATLGIVGAVGLCALLATKEVFHGLTSQSPIFVVLIPVIFALTGGMLAVYLPDLLRRPALGGVVGSAPPGAAAVISVAAAPTARVPSPAQARLLSEFDRSHMILLHMATVTLFVGLVLGAVWADYSWGRPWGWDPKEVFALVTWLFYAILIHVRFATPRRALWTAVLSCAGFAAMQFNWWVVNFHIVGLHSYA